MKKILVIDDELDVIRPALDEVLEDFPVVYAGDGTEGLQRLADDVGVVLLDITMPPMLGDDRRHEGLAVMAEICRRRPGLPVVMFTSHAELGLALEAGRLGAFDYLVKFPDPGKLLSVVENALAVDSTPGKATRRRDRFGGLVGQSPRMQKLYAEIEKVAPTRLSILLLGPNGSGKDLVAQEIHRASPRTDGPWRAVNVSAIPRELFESVLFGHARGSFTGATDDKPGEFELSSSGTLFLDEIGTLSEDVQVKLLRALEEKSVTRVGETAPRDIDTRVIAATNANLLKEVREGRFREDLYYRLRVATIMVPALVDHAEDVPALATHFLDAVVDDEGLPRRRFAQDALDALCAHRWPGNVRSLANVVRSAAVFAQGEEIRAGDLDLDDETGRVTVHDLDGLYDDQKSGTTGVPTPKDFKTKFGEDALRAVLARAVKETGDQGRAGVLLGFLSADHTPEERNTFRQWFRRVGLTSRDILG